MNISIQTQCAVPMENTPDFEEFVKYDYSLIFHIDMLQHLAHVRLNKSLSPQRNSLAFITMPVKSR